jgi:hypothetical protein
MYTNGFMPKPSGKTVGTFLTDPADLLFVEKEAELEGRTVSNWLRKKIKEMRQRSENTENPNGQN